MFKVMKRLRFPVLAVILLILANLSFPLTQGASPYSYAFDSSNPFAAQFGLYSGDNGECPSCIGIGDYTNPRMIAIVDPVYHEIQLYLTFKNTSASPSDQPVKNTTIIAFVPGQKDLWVLYTDETGQATMNLSYYDKMKPAIGCQSFVFIYCPFSNGCGLEQCFNMTGITRDTINTYPSNGLLGVPGAPGISFVPSPILLPETYSILPAMSAVPYCPMPPPEASKIPGDICLPFLLVLGLLIGAMQLSGKNPFAGFDFSSPRISYKPRYEPRMRGKALNWGAFAMSMASTAGEIYSATQEGGDDKGGGGGAYSQFNPTEKGKFTPKSIIKAVSHVAIGFVPFANSMNMIGKSLDRGLGLGVGKAMGTEPAGQKSLKKEIKEGFAHAGRGSSGEAPVQWGKLLGSLVVQTVMASNLAIYVNAVLMPVYGGKSETTATPGAGGKVVYTGGGDGDALTSFFKTLGKIPVIGLLFKFMTASNQSAMKKEADIKQAWAAEDAAKYNAHTTKLETNLGYAKQMQVDVGGNKANGLFLQGGDEKEKTGFIYVNGQVMRVDGGKVLVDANSNPVTYNQMSVGANTFYVESSASIDAKTGRLSGLIFDPSGNGARVVDGNIVAYEKNGKYVEVPKDSAPVSLSKAFGLEMPKGQELTLANFTADFKTRMDSANRDSFNAGGANIILLPGGAMQIHTDSLDAQRIDVTMGTALVGEGGKKSDKIVVTDPDLVQAVIPELHQNKVTLKVNPDGSISTDLIIVHDSAALAKLGMPPEEAEKRRNPDGTITITPIESGNTFRIGPDGKTVTNTSTGGTLSPQEAAIVLKWGQGVELGETERAAFYQSNPQQASTGTTLNFHDPDMIKNFGTDKVILEQSGTGGMIVRDARTGQEILGETANKISALAQQSLPPDSMPGQPGMTKFIEQVNNVRNELAESRLEAAHAAKEYYDNFGAHFPDKYVEAHPELEKFQDKLSDIAKQFNEGKLNEEQEKAMVQQAASEAGAKDKELIAANLFNSAMTNVLYPENIDTKNAHQFAADAEEKAGVMRALLLPSTTDGGYVGVGYGVADEAGALYFNIQQRDTVAALSLLDPTTHNAPPELDVSRLVNGTMGDLVALGSNTKLPNADVLAQCAYGELKFANDALKASSQADLDRSLEDHRRAAENFAVNMVNSADIKSNKDVESIANSAANQADTTTTRDVEDHLKSLARLDRTMERAPEGYEEQPSLFTKKSPQQTQAERDDAELDEMKRNIGYTPPKKRKEPSDKD